MHKQNITLSTMMFCFKENSKNFEKKYNAEVYSKKKTTYINTDQEASAEVQEEKGNRSFTNQTIIAMNLQNTDCWAPNPRVSDSAGLRWAS